MGRNKLILVHLGEIHHEVTMASIEELLEALVVHQVLRIIGVHPWVTVLSQRVHKVTHEVVHKVIHLTAILIVHVIEQVQEVHVSGGCLGVDSEFLLLQGLGTTFFVALLDLNVAPLDNMDFLVSDQVLGDLEILEKEESAPLGTSIMDVSVDQNVFNFPEF